MGPAVVLGRSLTRLSSGDGGFLQLGQDLGREFRGHLHGDAEPAGEVGFEGFLISVADLVRFANFNHDTAFFFREEDGDFVDEFGKFGAPFFGAVGVVVHLQVGVSGGEGRGDGRDARMQYLRS